MLHWEWKWVEEGNGYKLSKEGGYLGKWRRCRAAVPNTVSISLTGPCAREMAKGRPNARRQLLCDTKPTKHVRQRLERDWFYETGHVIIDTLPKRTFHGYALAVNARLKSSPLILQRRHPCKCENVGLLSRPRCLNLPDLYGGAIS
jgi:hypothetical protein